MQCAGAALASEQHELEWLGQKDDLGLPTFLPRLPKPQQDRLEAAIQPEVTRSVRGAGRRGGSGRSR